MGMSREPIAATAPAQAREFRKAERAELTLLKHVCEESSLAPRFQLFELQFCAPWSGNTRCENVRHIYTSFDKFLLYHPGCMRTFTLHSMKLKKTKNGYWNSRAEVASTFDAAK